MSIKDACGDKLSHKSADSGVQMCSATSSVSPIHCVRCGVLSVLVFGPQVTCGGSWEIQSAEPPTGLSDQGPQ